MPARYYQGRDRPYIRDNYSLGEHSTVEELTSPRVMKRAAQILKEIRRREEPMMRELENATRLSAEDYTLRMNC
ncbi:MAG: hypothetical protein AABX95_01945 [Nanoarchaeota archaeon]